MYFLIRFLGILFFIWLFRQFVAIVTKSWRKEPDHRTATAANQMVKDPVCGMYMDPRLAVRMESNNQAFYFCSEDCRKKYLNHPPDDRAGAAPPQ
jgi:YHS domain-containing protein